MGNKSITIIDDTIIKISDKQDRDQYSFTLPDWVDEGYVLDKKDIKCIYNFIANLPLSSSQYYYPFQSMNVPFPSMNVPFEGEIYTILKLLRQRTDINFTWKEPTEETSINEVSRKTVSEKVDAVSKAKNASSKFLTVIGNKTRVTTKELEFSTPIPDNVTVGDGYLIKTSSLCKVVSILNAVMYYVTDSHLHDQIKKIVKELNSQFFELEEEETSKNKEVPYKSASEKVDADCIDIFNFVEEKFKEIYDFIGFKNEAKMKLSISDKKQKVVFGEKKFNGYKLNIEAKIGGSDK